MGDPPRTPGAQVRGANIEENASGNSRRASRYSRRAFAICCEQSLVLASCHTSWAHRTSATIKPSVLQSCNTLFGFRPLLRHTNRSHAPAQADKTSYNTPLNDVASTNPRSYAAVTLVCDDQFKVDEDNTRLAVSPNHRVAAVARLFQLRFLQLQSTAGARFSFANISSGRHRHGSIEGRLSPKPNAIALRRRCAGDCAAT